MCAQKKYKLISILIYKFVNKKKKKVLDHNLKNRYVKIKQSQLLPSTLNKDYHRHHLRNYLLLVHLNPQKYMILNHNNHIIRN